MKSPGRGKRGFEGGKAAGVRRKVKRLESAVETPNRGKVERFGAPDGSGRLDVRLEQETVWLDFKQIAELFGRAKPVVSRHLRSLFETGELDRRATVAENATVQLEGDREVVRDRGRSRFLSNVRKLRIM